MRERASLLPAGLRASEANARWLSSHPDAWERHAGEWLYIVDEQLVVAENDQRVFTEKVRQIGEHDGALILRIPTPEELAAAHPALHP